MKSLKEYSINMTEPEYHSYPAWSHSLIARYAREGFGSIKNIHEHIEPTEAMRFGSFFDCVLTRNADVDKEYVVVSATIPEAERKALDYISSKTDHAFDSLSKEFIDGCCKEAGYYPKWGADAHYSHLEPFKDYYSLLKSGKIIVSEKDWRDAIEMEAAFRNNEYLNSLFGTKNNDKIEYLYQLKFIVYVNINGEKHKLKIMPDLLVVNHEDKTIQPVDLKTSTNPAYEFAESFVRMRYDLEASVYSDVLNVVKNNTEEYRDYAILPYIFVDISRSDKKPLSFIYDQNAPEQVDGFSFSKGDKTFRYKHWRVLLQEMIEYDRTNASIPNYIMEDKPNDILSLINYSN